MRYRRAVRSPAVLAVLVVLVVLVVLGACGVRSTGSQRDAAPAEAMPPRDAPWWIDAPADAYVRRPCDAPPTFADGLAPTRVLHVEAGAVGGDGSSAAPLGSITAAAAIATPGTFIQLGPGVHATNQFVPALRGTATAPIWIGGTPDTSPRPIIRGGSEALHLTRPAYVVIQHLAIEQQTANGINIDDGISFAGDAHHVAIVDVQLSRINSEATLTCIKVSGVDDLAIYDSRLHACSQGIDLVGVHRGVIARNTLTQQYLVGVQVRGGSTDVDVRQNRLRDTGTAGVNLGGSTPLAQFRPPLSTTAPNAEARRVRVFDNAVTGTTNAPFVFRTCVDCLVAHNLVWGTPAYLLRMPPSTATQNGFAFELTKNGRVINNSFIWRSAMLTAHVETGPTSAPETFTFSHNLWFASDQPVGVPPLSQPTLPVPEAGSVIGVGTGYAPEITGLYCDGPEVNAAAPLPEIDGTLEGFCRADAVAPTIGPQAQMHKACIPI